MNVMLSGLGKAGKELVAAFSQAPDVRIMGGICRDGSEKQGADIGEIAGLSPLDAQVYSISQLRDVLIFMRPDVVVDFSAPSITMRIVELCKEFEINLVIGTTGFSIDQLNLLKDYSRRCDIAILYAPNITLGVNVLIAMAQLAAKHLEGYDFSITEIHYRGKKDAPSGTANTILKALDQSMNENSRQHTAIIINSVRAGGYIGRHEVMAVGENDKIVLIHESFSRKAFADGALLAVRNIEGLQGWLEMTDVIQLKN